MYARCVLRAIRLPPFVGVPAFAAVPAATGLPPIAASASTPTIKLHVGHSVTDRSGHWLSGERVTCTGDSGDTIDGNIPAWPRGLIDPWVGKTLDIGHNHGLTIASLQNADGSLTVTCSPDSGLSPWARRG